MRTTRQQTTAIRISGVQTLLDSRNGIVGKSEGDRGAGIDRLSLSQTSSQSQRAQRVPIPTVWTWSKGGSSGRKNNPLLLSSEPAKHFHGQTYATDVSQNLFGRQTYRPYLTTTRPLSGRWPIRIRRSHRHIGKPFNAVLKIIYQLHNRISNPGVVGLKILAHLARVTS